MIYIICFTVSTICAYLDTRDERNKRMGIFGWIAVLLPSILAGVRDFSIGTDTAAYTNIFARISGATLFKVITGVSTKELGFKLLLFFVSRFTDDPHWAFFAAHLFIMFFIYKGLRDNGAGKYTWLGLAVFYFVFFGSSLNILRQYMASALIVWGFRYVKNEKFISWLIVVIIAAMFHRTSIIAIFIYFLYQIYVIRIDGTFKNGTAHRIKPEIKIVISVCILAGALVIFLFARPLIRLVHDITGKFSVQANTIRDYFAIDLYSIWRNLEFLIPFLLFRKSEANTNGDCDFYSIVFALCMILGKLSMVSYNAGRIIEPYWIQIVLAVPLLISGLNNKTNRIVISGYYLLLCGWVFLNNFVINGYCEIWPYTSEILGIG